MKILLVTMAMDIGGAETHILELAKEASIKTDEIVGDGTTTTLVLLEEIFNQGLELIKNGKENSQRRTDTVFKKVLKK